MRILILFLLCILAPASFAKEKKKLLWVCVPGEKISEKLDDCEQNTVMVKYAKDCLAHLEKQVSNTGKGLDLLFKASKKGMQQKGNFQASAQSFGVSSFELAQLAMMHTVAATEVQEYRDWVILPEDSEEPLVTGPDAQAFIDKISCYADPRKELAKIADELRARATSLTLAQKAAEVHGAASGSNKNNLKSLTEGPVTTGQGASAPAAKEGKTAPLSSGISGIEEEKAKREQKPVQ